MATTIVADVEVDTCQRQLSSAIHGTRSQEIRDLPTSTNHGVVGAGPNDQVLECVTVDVDVIRNGGAKVVLGSARTFPCACAQDTSRAAAEQEHSAALWSVCRVSQLHISGLRHRHAIEAIVVDVSNSLNDKPKTSVGRVSDKRLGGRADNWINRDWEHRVLDVDVVGHGTRVRVHMRGEDLSVGVRDVELGPSKDGLALGVVKLNGVFGDMRVEFSLYVVPNHQRAFAHGCAVDDDGLLQALWASNVFLLNAVFVNQRERRALERVLARWTDSLNEIFAAHREFGQTVVMTTVLVSVRLVVVGTRTEQMQLTVKLQVRLELLMKQRRGRPVLAHVKGGEERGLGCACFWALHLGSTLRGGLRDGGDLDLFDRRSLRRWLLK